jgi:hypothetical protein
MTDITRATASALPVTADETTRSVELVIASEAPIGGLVLRCNPGAVLHGPAPVPVLLSHQNQASEMAGRITDLRFEGDQLIGRAVFTDAPAAEAGWQLARSGCAVSVGASYEPADLKPLNKSADIASRWRLREASLVPVGADPACLTRSHPPASPPMNDQTQAQTVLEDRAALKRERDILRSCQAARLSAERTQEFIDSGASHNDVVRSIFDQMYANQSQSTAGHPVACAAITRGEVGPTAIERALDDALAGKRLEAPLWLLLRDAGVGRGNEPAAVWRSALSGEGRWLQRDGAMSTSDLPNLLTAAGNRRLQSSFSEAVAGIRAATFVRPLVDYRAASVLDAGAVGTAQQILEGGEIKFGSVSETATSYKPSRYGLGLSFTPESLANDDLQGLQQAIDELGAAMLDREALALVDLLEGAANGRNAPDGLALFATAHANSNTGAVGIDTIAAAVAKLRKQTAIGGRFIQQDPVALICSPDQETICRQLTSIAVNPTQASNLNPWRVDVAVEPRLSGQYVYLLGNGRQPLELGRLTDAPVLSTETEFSTSTYRIKSEHSFGTAVIGHRSIVRIATTA